MDYTVRTTKRQYAATPLVLRMFGTGHLQEKVNRPSGLPLWQIIFGEAGSGRFRIEGRDYLLREGQFAVIPPHTGHRYESAGGDWTVAFLGFGGNSCQKLLTDLRLAEPGVYRPGGSAAGEEGLISHLRKFETLVMSETPRKHRLLSKELYSALLDLSEGSSLERTAPWKDPDGLVSDILLFLEEHCGEDVSLRQLSEEYRLTPEYLCARFKAGTGETIVSRLRRVRIGRARLLLLERPELSLAEIGELCGYRSASYFGKVFREMTGTTPQSFRSFR